MVVAVVEVAILVGTHVRHREGHNCCSASLTTVPRHRGWKLPKHPAGSGRPLQCGLWDVVVDVVLAVLVTCAGARAARHRALCSGEIAKSSQPPHVAARQWAQRHPVGALRRVRQAVARNLRRC